MNYLPTVEVDYSGMHLLMMYNLNDLTPSNRNMYDIGIWKTEAEKEQKRPIVKEFLNTIVNDEFGDYKMYYESKKILGMSNKALRKRITHKHPGVTHRFNSGY